MLARGADARDDLLGTLGEDDQRAPSLDHRGVPRIQAQGEGIGKDAFGTECALERAPRDVDVGHDAVRLARGCLAEGWLRDVAGLAIGRAEGPALLLPLLEPPLEVVCLEPTGAEHVRRELAPVPGPADHDGGLRPVELPGGARQDRVQRDVDRPLDPARLPLVQLAAVDHLHLVEMLGQAGRGREVRRDVAHRANPIHGVRNDGNQAPSARSNASYASRPNRTSGTSATSACAPRTASTATAAASRTG